MPESKNSRMIEAPLIEAPLIILCGGKGTRLGAQTTNTPKSLVPVLGEPFLAHQLKLLQHAGFRQITLCTGHLGEQIDDFVEEYRAENQALQISCLSDPPGLVGTGGALARACESAVGTICFTYGDSYLDIDFRAVLDTFAQRKARALVTLIDRCRVNHAANIVLEDGFVTFYGKDAARSDLKYIDYGFTVLSADLLHDFAPGAAFDLGQLFSDLASKRMLHGLELTQPFHEIGTPEGLRELEQYLLAKSTSSA